MSSRRIRLIAGAAVAGLVVVAVAIGARSGDGPHAEPAIGEPAAAAAPPVVPAEPTRDVPPAPAPTPPPAVPRPSPRADELSEERTAAKVDALVHAGRIGAARDAAEAYFARFPKGPSAQHIEMLTGVHPRPPAPDQR